VNNIYLVSLSATFG